MSESPRQDLDEAIDRVAANLVAADDDAAMLHRVMAQLPARRAGPGFLAWPAQLAGAAAIVAVALVYPRSSREFAPPEFAPASAPLALAKPAEVRPETPVGEPVVTAVRRLPTPDSHLRQGYGGLARLPAVTRDDHERSLPPVAAIEAIELSEIAAPAIELDAPASLEPLVLTDVSLEIKGDW